MRDVDSALDRLADALSFPSGKLEAIPYRGADVRALWDAVDRASERHSQAMAWLALKASACDRIAEAIGSMVDLLDGSRSSFTEPA